MKLCPFKMINHVYDDEACVCDPNCMWYFEDEATYISGCCINILAIGMAFPHWATRSELKQKDK